MGSLLLLRRVRVFNKSKYARNRQLARVIFYFGLYINLLIIYGSFSMLYGFVFKFNYAIWVVYFVFSCFLLPSAFRVWKLTRVLQYLLSWKAYRSFKSGLLADFFIKRVFIGITRYFTQTFSIFFLDKFTLEYFFVKTVNTWNMFFEKLNLKQTRLVDVLKTIIVCHFYLILLGLIIYF